MFERFSRIRLLYVVLAVLLLVGLLPLALTGTLLSRRSADELRAIYEEQNGISGDTEVISYCRIGERSSHTWFVLRYLLGYRNVKNYDGSWTEWGNAVRAPIEKGPEK